jgi:Domain of unknown function (DUF4279)
MTAPNQCYAYFYISGIFDPATITAEVGVTPTKTGVQGDLIPGTQMPRKCSRWMLYSRLERSATLESHVTDVLDQLDLNRNGFRRLSIEHGGTMELVGYFRAYYPGLFFEREIVERLAQYALSLDCDFYMQSDAEEVPTSSGEPE